MGTWDPYFSGKMGIPWWMILSVLRVLIIRDHKLLLFLFGVMWKWDPLKWGPRIPIFPEIRGSCGENWDPLYGWLFSQKYVGQSVWQTITTEIWGSPASIIWVWNIRSKAVQRRKQGIPISQWGPQFIRKMGTWGFHFYGGS